MSTQPTGPSKVQQIATLIAQGNVLAATLVPAVSSMLGLVLSLAAQAKARGWSVDTKAAEDAAATFHGVREFLAAEKAKYQGKR